MVGIGLTAASTLASVSASREQSQFQSIISKNNAAYQENAARDAEKRGLAAEDAQRMALRRLVGTQRARYGASGVDLGGGSPEDVLLDTIRQSENDVLTIRNNAAREAFGYRTQAWGEKVKGRASRRRSKSDQFNTLLTSGAEAYGISRSRSY
jgi:hypothetical protein